jgi:archaellin
MNNQILFGVLLLVAAVASSVLIATSWSQTASASAYGADIDVEEAAAAENATVTNKTTSANMTGANSTR